MILALTVTKSLCLALLRRTENKNAICLETTLLKELLLLALANLLHPKANAIELGESLAVSVQS